MAEQRAPEERPQQPRRERRDGARRAYTSPRLIEYGSVAKLTRGSRSVDSDFPQSGFKRRSCL